MGPLITLLQNDAVAVGAGAVLGALSRYQAGRMAADWIATDAKHRSVYQGWHTAAINVGGSFFLGGIAGAPTTTTTSTGPSSIFARKPPTLTTLRPSSPTTPSWMPQMKGLSPRTKLMMGVGFCGSFTTFSTFSVDVVGMINNGQASKACAYIMANNVGGVLAAATGLMVVQKLFGR